MRQYTANELRAMPNLSPCTRYDHLKVDTPTLRVWLFRDGTVQVERPRTVTLAMGVKTDAWEVVEKYQG